VRKARITLQGALQRGERVVRKNLQTKGKRNGKGERTWGVREITLQSAFRLNQCSLRRKDRKGVRKSLEVHKCIEGKKNKKRDVGGKKVEGHFMKESKRTKVWKFSVSQLLAHCGGIERELVKRKTTWRRKHRAPYIRRKKGVRGEGTNQAGQKKTRQRGTPER